MIEEPGHLSILRRSGSDRGAEASAAAACRVSPGSLPLGRVVERLGETVSIEQGLEAAQWTAMNALAGMKQALGDLERVVSLIKSLNFVACAPTFTDAHARTRANLAAETARADRAVAVDQRQRDDEVSADEALRRRDALAALGQAPNSERQRPAPAVATATPQPRIP